MLRALIHDTSEAGYAAAAAVVGGMEDALSGTCSANMDTCIQLSLANINQSTVGVDVGTTAEDFGLVLSFDRIGICCCRCRFFLVALLFASFELLFLFFGSTNAQCFLE